MMGTEGELLVAVCSAIGTAAGTFGGIRLMSYRIGQLEKQVEKLGGVIDRTYSLERRAEVEDERITAVLERLGRIERGLSAGNERRT